MIDNSSKRQSRHETPPPTATRLALYSARALARVPFIAALSLALLSLPGLGPRAALAASPPGALAARAWELVSPATRGGGDIGTPGSSAAGALQASSEGDGVAFGSTASFAEAIGAPPVSQYRGARVGGAWSTENLSPPLLSGTYASGAYQLFSADLSRALLANGWSCRLAEASCPAANPPLAQGAPIGYRNLYLREGATYLPLITAADAPSLTLGPAEFQLALAGASPDLRHVVVSTCAKLTPEAVELPGGGGACEAGETNLYEFSEGALSAVNLLPAAAQSTPGAQLAAPNGAISSDGARVYFTDEPAPGETNLYLRQGAQTQQVDAAVGGGGIFQAASADGSLAFFTKAGSAYRYDAVTQTTSEPLASGVIGVLGASADGAYLYYLTPTGLFLYHAGSSTKVAAAADSLNYPPATGVARISADGTRLTFLSSAALTAYNNQGRAEAYLYDASSAHLLCASCNPKGSPPVGAATLPGATAAGEGPAAYRPRSLSADGTRLFFTSPDSLILGDTDNRADVYEWQAPGAGGCDKPAGCLGLISGGRIGASAFADASASGDDVFFTTAASLLPADREAEDLYDARAGGGFAEAPPAIPCEGDACQGPPPGPQDPTPGTATFQGPENPSVPSPKTRPKKRGKKKSGKRRHHHRRHRHDREARR